MTASEKKVKNLTSHNDIALVRDPCRDDFSKVRILTKLIFDGFDRKLRIKKKKRGF
jgi:hypothetical protein